MLYCELDYWNVVFFVISRKVLLFLCYISVFSVGFLCAYHFFNVDKITCSVIFNGKLNNNL